MKTLRQYSLEFMVVFISITASFLLEEYRTTRNRESLKNRALGRMLENFKTDIKDTRFNIWLQQNAIQAAEKVKRATKNKAKTPQDSIDQWLTKAYTTATTFVDNTEEYNSLKSTQHELSSRINQQRLDESIEALKSGKKIVKKLSE